MPASPGGHVAGPWLPSAVGGCGGRRRPVSRA